MNEKTIKPAKPRNQVVLALVQRQGGAGVHEKTEKAKRKQAEQQFKQQLAQLDLKADDSHDA
ncbi:MAG: hypothetical protein AB1400_03450 [Pseudomonadota bacterium]